MFGKQEISDDAFEEEAAVDMSDDGFADVELSGPVAIDLGAVRDEPVGQGWHTVEVERCEPKLSRQKGLPSLFVMARVTDESDIDHGRTLVWNLMLDGDGMVFTKRCFAALRMPEVLDYPSYQDLADALIGRSVDAKVKHATYQGQLQAKVNNWRPFTPDISF